MTALLEKFFNSRTLMVLGGIVVALFVTSGLIASKYGQHAEGTAGTVGAVAWFGFLIGFVALVAASVVSLVLYGMSRSDVRGNRS